MVHLQGSSLVTRLLQLPTRPPFSPSRRRSEAAEEWDPKASRHGVSSSRKVRVRPSELQLHFLGAPARCQISPTRRSPRPALTTAAPATQFTLAWRVQASVPGLRALLADWIHSCPPQPFPKLASAYEQAARLPWGWPRGWVLSRSF